VPHGKVTYSYYKSSILGTTLSLLVYTPPGINANETTKYPVLYLVHRGPDTEETWTKVGHASLIADNLIAQLKLLTISVGTEDFLYESVKQNIAMFHDKKLNLETFIVPGSKL